MTSFKELRTKIETSIQDARELPAIQKLRANLQGVLQNKKKLEKFNKLSPIIEVLGQKAKQLGTVFREGGARIGSFFQKVQEFPAVKGLRAKIRASIEKVRDMPALKALQAKIEALIHRAKEEVSRHLRALENFLAPTWVTLRKIYDPAIRGVSKACESLAFAISATATFVHLIAFKIDKLFKYIRRRLHVRKILSARTQWYVNKKGNFYNPKLKATIYPSWECTWNIAQASDIYQGYESKKQAQEIAFKMWMKMRLLKRRLDTQHSLDAKIPINLTHKILSNKIQLRKPTLRDLDQLATLMEQSNGSEAHESIKARLQTYATQSNYQVLLAERGKKVVGFIAFVLYDLFISEGKRCRIEGLVVDAKSQDLSIKRKLIQAVEDFARNNKGKVVDLTADLDSPTDAMRDLYKFLGYSSEGAVAKTYLKKDL